MDLTADNEDSRRLQTQIKKWDRKKKKIVTVNNVRQFISGLCVYKSLHVYKNRFLRWIVVTEFQGRKDPHGIRCVDPCDVQNESLLAVEGEE